LKIYYIINQNIIPITSLHGNMSEFEIPEIIVQSPWEVEELLGNSINCTKRPCNLSISEKLKEKLLKNRLKKDEKMQNICEQRPFYGGALGRQDTTSNHLKDENNNTDKQQFRNTLPTNTFEEVKDICPLELATEDSHNSVDCKTNETNNRNFLTVNWTERQNVLDNKRKPPGFSNPLNGTPIRLHRELMNRQLSNHHQRPKTISSQHHHCQVEDTDYYNDDSSDEDEDDEDEDFCVEFENITKKNIVPCRQTLKLEGTNVTGRQILLKRKTRPWVIDDTSLSAMKKMKL